MQHDILLGTRFFNSVAWYFNTIFLISEKTKRRYGVILTPLSSECNGQQEKNNLYWKLKTCKEEYIETKTTVQCPLRRSVIEDNEELRAFTGWTNNFVRIEFSSQVVDVTIWWCFLMAKDRCSSRCWCRWPLVRPTHSSSHRSHKFIHNALFIVQDWFPFLLF